MRAPWIYLCPIGAHGLPLAERVVPIFEAGRVILPVYDGSTLGELERYAWRGPQGLGKFEYALRILHGTIWEECGAEWVFLWDDDLLPTVAFDPWRMVAEMERRQLMAAQPAILAPGRVAHEITRARYHSAERLGRITDFVEIMAPCYSRCAWEILRWKIGAKASFDGIGYDMVDIGLCGIFDAMPIVHMRPVRAKKLESKAARDKWMQEAGVSMRHPQNLGWMRSHDAARPRSGLGASPC